MALPPRGIASHAEKRRVHDRLEVVSVTWAGARPGRVVVGVSDSLTGLRALREAVGAARLRGQELRAVRAYPEPRTSSGYYASAAGLPGVPAAVASDVASQEARLLRAEGERHAREVVGQAFAKAMGGLPDDVEVSIVTYQGPPRRMLVGAARAEQDLIVVGTTRRSWWCPFRRSLSGYVSGRAQCPVLAVPPSAAADTLVGYGPLRRWAWRHRALPRELSDLSSEVAPR